MKTVCDILTTDLEGGPARIPFLLFKELYTYLAEIDGEIPKEHVDTVIEHLSYDVWVAHDKSLQSDDQKLTTNLCLSLNTRKIQWMSKIFLLKRKVYLLRLQQHNKTACST